MSEIKEHVEKWINLMICKYPWIKFVYEVSEDNIDHNICVYPKNLIESSEGYCNDEIDFVFELDKLFPNNNVLFSIEEELFSCSDNAKVYDINNNGVIDMSTSENLKYKSSKVYNNNVSDYCSYALAA